MAQRTDKSHVLIVLDSANSMQPRAPHPDLLKEPLIRFRLTPVTPDHHLLRRAPAVRTKHRMQAQHGAIMGRQHCLQRTAFHRCQIDQNTVGRQGRQLRYDLFSNMNRHADDHHSGIGDNVPGARPVLLFQNTDLIARQREHFSNRRPICPPPPTMTTGRREGQSVLNPLSFSLE